MYIDTRNQFAAAVQITATGQLGDTIDLTSDRDIGPGRPMFLVLQLDAAPDGTTGDETYSVALQTDDNSAFSSATDIATLTVPRSTAAGTRYVIGFPYANERYLRVYPTLGGTTPIFKATAWLTDQPPTAWHAYPAAI